MNLRLPIQFPGGGGEGRGGGKRRRRGAEEEERKNYKIQLLLTSYTGTFVTERNQLKYGPITPVPSTLI